ncbi:hypothetical protein ScPMuIL_004672 [Solemya velum]
MSMMDLFDIDELHPVEMWMPDTLETKIGDGDIFDLGFSGVQDEFTYKAGLSTPDALDSLLFPDQLDPLPVEDEWMERVDMTSFLDMDKQNATEHVKPEPISPPKVKEETNPKPCRLRLLQELLLQGVPQKTPASPEAQVAPDIDVLDSLTEKSSLVLSRDHEIAPEICFDSYSADPVSLSDHNSVIIESWNREGSLSSVSSGFSSFESSSHTTNASTQSNISSDYMDDGLTQPLSSDDMESILSGSAPSSPCSDDPEYLPDLVENSKRTSRKSRQTPYSRGGGECLSRKEKKKLQNKNAAIRYRQKKKAESESVKLRKTYL